MSGPQAPAVNPARFPHVTFDAEDVPSDYDVYQIAVGRVIVERYLTTGQMSFEVARTVRSFGRLVLKRAGRTSSPDPTADVGEALFHLASEMFFEILTIAVARILAERHGECPVDPEAARAMARALKEEMRPHVEAMLARMEAEGMGALGTDADRPTEEPAHLSPTMRGDTSLN